MLNRPGDREICSLCILLWTIQIVIRYGIQIVIRKKFNKIGGLSATLSDEHAYIVKRLIASDRFQPAFIRTIPFYKFSDRRAMAGSISHAAGFLEIERIPAVITIDCVFSSALREIL